jgi:hypothetical protein
MDAGSTMSGKREGGAVAAILTALSAALPLCSCTSNPYVIGALAGVASDGGTPADGDIASPGLSFAADFDQSGVSLLDNALSLRSGKIAATLLLQGERATSNDWPSASGGILTRGAGASSVGLEAPFTDASAAVSMHEDNAIYAAPNGDLGAVDADDFVIELVLRGEPGAVIAEKRFTSGGWSLAMSLQGALTLDLGSAHSIASEPLVPDAWYHCLFWVSRNAGGQAFCNTRPGPSVDLHGLGSLVSTDPMTVGGVGRALGVGNGARTPLTTELAELAIFRASPGMLDGSDPSTIARERFAVLTGTYPRVARGNALAKPGLRDSPAYLDLLRDSSPARRLFLVGPDWPRLSCRADAAGTRDCGYLSEPKRTRWADPRPSGWTPSGLAIGPDATRSADVEPSMTSLIPSTINELHSLAWSGTYGPAHQAVSFFARAAGGHLVGASVTNIGSAVFDIAGGAVLSSPAGARATIERWGDQLVRCALAFDAPKGALTYQIDLMSDPAGAAFAGDGSSPWINIGGLQVDVGQSYAGSLIAGAQQAADQLTFVADDGNFPAGDAVSVGFRLMVPSGPRQNDQAVINLNRGGAFDNQVQVFVRGNETAADNGKLQFWGLRDGATYWTFFHPTPAVDGLRHAVVANWTATTADMQVDGVPAHGPAVPNAPPFAFDRIDVGFSTMSSGSLEGLLAGLSIGEP